MIALTTSSDLDPIINVLGLSPKDPLDSFVEIWYMVFLWAFFSSVIIHAGAAAAAFASLRRHKMARFFPAFIFVSGILTPLCASLITSALIAGIYRAANFQIAPIYALFFGVGQTLLTLIFAYTRIMATL